MVLSRPFIVFLTLALAVHAGCIAAQQLAVFALSGVAVYGDSFWAGTPVDGLLSFTRINSFLNLRGIFFALGNTLSGIFGLLVFNYGMFEGHSGAAQLLIALLRTVMSVATGAVTLTICQALFSSGIFQSTAGIALVIGSVGIATIISSLT